MYCESCGFKNEESVTFCENCGVALNQHFKPQEKSSTIIFPSIVNLVCASILSLIVLGIIIYFLIGVTSANSLLRYLPLDLSGIFGTSIFFFFLIVATFFLPVIICNYLAYKGLRNSEATGYKWGLITAFYGLLSTLSLFLAGGAPWILGLVLVAIPIASIVCILWDRNLVNFTSNPIEILVPAILSLTFFYGLLHSVLISAVFLLVSLISTSSVNSFIGMIPGASIVMGYIIIFIIIFAVVLTLLIILFYKLGTNLLNNRPNSHILGIVVYGLITLFWIITFVESGYINFMGLLLLLLFASQVIFLSLNSTRIILNRNKGY